VCREQILMMCALLLSKVLVCASQHIPLLIYYIVPFGAVQRIHGIATGRPRFFLAARLPACEGGVCVWSGRGYEY
jgi:hypothetical protein